MIPVLVLSRLGVGVASEKGADLRIIQGSEFPAVAVDSVLTLGPRSFQVNKGAWSQFVDFEKLWMVAPGLEGEAGSGIGESEF